MNKKKSERISIRTLLMLGCFLLQVFLIAFAQAAEKGEEKEDRGVIQDESERKVLYWYDPMSPGVRFDKPGKSPYMDMDLVPRYANEEDVNEEDHGYITISAEAVQKIGVRTEKVIKGQFLGGVRATGFVKENERLRYDVFSQVEGRIGELKYNAVGDQVRKGALFYTLYSPELLALQSDYLVALREGYADLAASARKRMTLLGVDKSFLERIDKNNKVYENVPFVAPASGILSNLAVRQGSYLKANDPIGVIQDLSRVWVEAAVPEKDLDKIKKTTMAKIMIVGTSEMLEAKVDYIYPTIAPETRTGRVRLLIENSDGLLKPEAYVTINFMTDVDEHLVVPTSAILRSSEGDHVIVRIGEGKFESRDIETGSSFRGETEILTGLKEGDDVVTSGQFLIDSESNLTESLNKLPSKTIEDLSGGWPEENKKIDMETKHGE